MRFTVIWDPEALKELARTWNETRNKKAVTLAVDRIDSELRNTPQTKGDPFNGDFHIMQGSVEVVYRVSEDDRLVTVLQVFVWD
jgi:mRNA-degrading endonuclease RelE of RelBE toxin-antitoxin system